MVLADCAGFREALAGGILLSGVTSLSGVVTSVTAAFEGHPALARSNAVGGIAAQTVFIAVADIFYNPANLEHASASILNLLQGVLLIVMLGFVFLVMTMPSFTFLNIHPASLFLSVLIWFLMPKINLCGNLKKHRRRWRNNLKKIINNLASLLAFLNLPS